MANTLATYSSRAFMVCNSYACQVDLIEPIYARNRLGGCIAVTNDAVRVCCCKPT